MGELRGVPIPVCVLRMCAVRVTLYAVGVRCPRGGCVWGGRVALCSAPVPGPRSVLCVRAGGPDLFPLRGKKVPCVFLIGYSYCFFVCVRIRKGMAPVTRAAAAPAAAAGAPGSAAARVVASGPIKQDPTLHQVQPGVNAGQGASTARPKCALQCLHRESILQCIRPHGRLRRAARAVLPGHQRRVLHPRARLSPSARHRPRRIRLTSRNSYPYAPAPAPAWHQQWQSQALGS
jgi:hypothetical protein